MLLCKQYRGLHCTLSQTLLRVELLVKIQSRTPCMGQAVSMCQNCESVSSNSRNPFLGICSTVQNSDPQSVATRWEKPLITYKNQLRKAVCYPQASQATISTTWSRKPNDNLCNNWPQMVRTLLIPVASLMFVPSSNLRRSWENETCIPRQSHGMLYF